MTVGNPASEGERDLEKSGRGTFTIKHGLVKENRCGFVEKSFFRVYPIRYPATSSARSLPERVRMRWSAVMAVEFTFMV